VRPTPTHRARAADIEAVARMLPSRLAVLGRLFTRLSTKELTRSMAGVLSSVADGPRRITELADLEGLAQPTVTVLVARMEERGLVARESDPDDRRVVLVAITESGRRALQRRRDHLSAVLRERMTGMSEEEVGQLLALTEALESLTGALQGRPED
jgi:DNA-binding MarR family transcriptional regulator